MLRAGSGSGADWPFAGTEKLSSPGFDANGVIYVGSLDGHLYAIEDSVTYGNPRWNTTLGIGNWSVYSSPVARVEGAVYVGCHDFSFYAVDSNGSII